MGLTRYYILPQSHRFIRFSLKATVLRLFLLARERHCHPEVDEFRFCCLQGLRCRSAFIANHLRGVSNRRESDSLN